MPNSEDPLKSKPRQGRNSPVGDQGRPLAGEREPLPPSKKRGRLLLFPLAGAVILAFLVMALGPTIFLHLALSRLFSAESGLNLSYGQVRAGFLFRSIRVVDLKIEDPDSAGGPPLMVLGRLRLDGVATWNLIRLLLRSEEVPSKPMFMAESLEIEGLGLRHGLVAARLDEASARRLRLSLNPSSGEIPLMFDKLESRNLALSIDSVKLRFDRLEARDLSREFLARLSFRNFYYGFDPDGPESRVGFNLDALALGGLRLESLKGILTGETIGQVAWGFLAGCDNLDMVRGTFTRSGREALNIKSIFFDSVNQPSDAASFLRRMELEVDLPALSGDSADIFWADFRDIAGDRFQAGLTLEVDYHPATGRAELKTARLEAPELGRMEFAGALVGVAPVKSHHSPSQLLLSTANWRLERMEFSFEDWGLAANFYRHLDRTTFRDAPHRRSAINIIDNFIKRLARDLEYDQGLDNLPALVNEVEAFILRPRSLKLSAAPSPPLPLLPVINSLTFMSLANQGKYDIIQKLRLTLAVNGRAPVFVAVASGVFKENLPLAPRPLENAFDDDMINEDDMPGTP